MREIHFTDGTRALVSDQDSDLLKYRWWKTQGYPASKKTLRELREVEQCLK